MPMTARASSVTFGIIGIVGAELKRVRLFEQREVLDAHRRFARVVHSGRELGTRIVGIRTRHPRGSGGAGAEERALVPSEPSRLQNTKHKKREAVNKRKAIVCTRFIVSPLIGFFSKHCLHDPDLGALAAVDVGREIEQFGILPGAGRVEQVLYHRQRAAVVLDHSGQKQTVELSPFAFLKASICFGVSMPGISMVDGSTCPCPAYPCPAMSGIGIVSRTRPAPPAIAS